MTDKKEGGLTINAGDRAYVPPGGMRFWVNSDGTTESRMSLAIDPWLPDLSRDAETPVDVIETIARHGFTVSAICTSRWMNACQKTHEVHELLAHPRLARLRHMAVIEDTHAVGILDLDRARGQVQHNDRQASVRVEEIFEPLCEENSLRSDSPLIDYVLTADTRPFRLVEMPRNKLGTIDVEDLQKVPVRVLLFMHFLQLEDVLVRRLCEKDPEMLDQMRYEQGVNAEPLGNSGAGPVRHIETYGFRKLLRQASERGFVTVGRQELLFLERYRNVLAHGGRWYITRRSDVAALVNCFKRVLALIHEAAE